MGAPSLREVLKRLLSTYGWPPKAREFTAMLARARGLGPLGTLIAIILTQNTNDRNANVALERLYKISDGFSRKKLLELSIEEIAEAIRVSGMQNQKARTIKAVAERFDDYTLIKEDPDTLAKKLLSVPGIGPKTVDVFLLMVRNYPTFPIDTHCRRVLTRLGFIRRGEKYEAIKEAVISELGRDREALLKLHTLLITHGRRVCTARKPRCGECPLRYICPRVGVDEG